MMRVLIVDDNEQLTALMKAVFEEEGFCRVETAGNGIDGYSTCLNFKPDVVLTDIDMPGKNGLEMVRDIRKHHPRIKTVYMSGDLRRHRPFLTTEEVKYNACLLNKPFRLSKVLGLFKEYEREISQNKHRQLMPV